MSTASRIAAAIGSCCSGPFRQFTPTMSAPASASLRAHSPGVSPSYDARLGLSRRHRHHHGQARRLRALDEQQRLAEPAERLADPEVGRPGVDLVLELPVEQRAHVVGRRGVVGLVGPRQGQVPGDQRVALVGDLARDLHGVPVDLVDLPVQPDGGELVVARVEGHRLQDVDAGAQELAVQLRQRVGVFDHHLGRERARPARSPRFSSSSR